MRETILRNIFIIASFSLVVFIGFPFLYVYYFAFASGIAITSEVWKSFLLSLFTAVFSTTLIALFGIPLAYFLARSKSSWKEAITTLITLPLVIPPLVAGIMILSTYGPQSYLGSLFAGKVHITNSLIGIILAQLFVTSPYLILTARAAFEGVSEELEKASLLLGKKPLETFFKITLPLSWPGILAGLIMSWARAMGEFGATIILTYHPPTLPVKIWTDFIGRGINSALAGVLIVVTISFFIIIFAVLTKERRIFFSLGQFFKWRGDYAQSSR